MLVVGSTMLYVMLSELTFTVAASPKTRPDCIGPAPEGEELFCGSAFEGSLDPHLRCLELRCREGGGFFRLGGAGIICCCGTCFFIGRLRQRALHHIVRRVAHVPRVLALSGVARDGSAAPVAVASRWLAGGFLGCCSFSNITIFEVVLPLHQIEFLDPADEFWELDLGFFRQHSSRVARFPELNSSLQFVRTQFHIH